MASEKSILQSMLKGGAGSNIEYPTWFKRFGPAVAAIPKAYDKAKQRKQQQASRDLTTISGFEARLGNKVNNYIASGDIYDESKISALKDSVNSLYDQHSSKFPELISEFSDERDSILGRINSYSTKNKQKDELLSKVNPTQDKIFSIAKVLNETSTANLSPNDRVEFKKQIRNAIEDVVKLDKLVDDPYYAGIDGWADTIEDVKYGISGSAKQLITQINTWQSATEGDPSSMYVISNNELEEMERAIFEGDLSGIAPLTERAEADKVARMKQYETDYNNYLKNYATISSFSDSQQYKKLKADKETAYGKLDKQGKINADNDPMYWFEYPMGDIPGMPEEGVNLQNIDAQKILTKTKAEDIDANYRNEHIAGASIAEILNKPLPWAKGKKSLDDKKTEFEGEIGESYTEGEHEYLQSLQKDIEPDVVAGDTVEINNPGNLRFANQTEATGKDDRGFAIFPTAEEGWDALYRQIELDKGRDLTLDKFINKYAPPSENDTTAYLKSIQKQLNTSKGTNINKLDTQKLAVAIAKQEGYAGTYPDIKGDPPPKSKGIKIDSPLTKVKDNKVVVNYSNASSTGFKRQQANLNKIASQKYNTKENKSKYDNVRNFVKAKFEEWLRSTGKYGKYAEGDFKYFIPTKVDRKNQINPSSDMNRYNLYYPGAFSGAKGDVRMMIKPKVGSGYLGFAEDFDEFREYLQES